MSTELKETKNKEPVSEVAIDKKYLQEKLHSLATTISQRRDYANQMGESFNGNRDLWGDCGYIKTTIEYQDYYNKYSRQDIVKRIVDSYPRATWSVVPEIFETEDREVTDFEKSLNKFIRDTKVFHYICRADRLACIGRYSVLVLGFDDGGDLDRPVKKASELLYIQPYSEGNAKVIKSELNPKNKRFGKPIMYGVQIGAENESTSKYSHVHYSRIIHIVTDPLESDIYGLPMLQSVYNRLCDLEKVVACSSEMYWRGAFPGIAFEAREGTTIGPQDMDDLEDEIEDYINSLSRYLKVRGIDVKTLAPNIVSPKEQIEAIITLIAATEGIPRRILLGTEEAKLAGSQDEIQWNERVAERRTLFATPFILRPFLNQMIELGVLPTPKDNEFTIEWPTVNTPSKLQLATIAKAQAESLARFSEGGSLEVIDPYSFLTEIMKFSKDKTEAILKRSLKYHKEKVKEQEAEDKALQKREDELLDRAAGERQKEIAASNTKPIKEKE